MTIRSLFRVTGVLALCALAVFPQRVSSQNTNQAGERQALKTKLKATLDREMSRQNVGACPDARNTLDINRCAGNDLGVTQDNHKEYAATIRALLTSMIEPEPAVLARFDDTEKAWETYRDAICGLEYEWYRGGTGAPSFAAQCRIVVTRNHLRDLAATVGGSVIR